MRVERRLVAQQTLQQDMDMRRRQHVLAACHHGHTLQMVVDRDRQMVAGRRVLAGHHEVPQQERLALDSPMAFVDEVVGPRLPGGALAIEPQAELVTGGDAIAPLFSRQHPAGAGIERSVGAVWRVGGSSDFPPNVGTAAKARIDQAALVELVQPATVIGEMLGLAPYLAVPVEAQPAQVLEHRLLEFAPATADVDVLDAHQEAATRLPGAMPAGPGRIGASQVQLARRTGGETRDHGHDRTLQRVRAACYAKAWLRLFSMPPISRGRCGTWRRSMRISRAC